MSSFLRKLWPSLAALAVTVVSLIVLPFAAALAVIALVCLVAIVRFFRRGAKHWSQNCQPDRQQRQRPDQAD